MEVDDNILMIVGGEQEILDQQLKHHPIHLINIIIIFTTDYIKFYII